MIEFVLAPIQNKLVSYFCVFFLSAIALCSCVKSNDPKPPITDSSYVINELSIFLGSDSSDWNYSTRNVFAFDSSKNQFTQTITEASFGDPNSYTYNTAYNYDNSNRLQNIRFGRNPYIYKSISFQYDASGNIQKAIITDRDDAVIENGFSVSIQNGNTIITQFDTLASNIGKGEYTSNRPAITRYTLNPDGRLINLHMVSSQTYNSRPPFEDTLDRQFSYDAKNHLTQTLSHFAETDYTGIMTKSNDTIRYSQEGISGSPVQDLATATLRTLDWLTTSDYVNLFKNLSSIQYGNVNREEPLMSSYDAFIDKSYSTSYQNNFNVDGLIEKSSLVIVEKNIYNPGNTTRESHYFKYLKIKK